MAAKLKIRGTVNSSVEELLGWKCCNLPGMNFEVIVENAGDEPVEIKSEIEVEGPGGIERINHLYPYGVHRIVPKDSLAFYGGVDEERAKRWTSLTIFDGHGQAYRAALTGESEDAEAI